jgi:hypothetical protein
MHLLSDEEGFKDGLLTYIKRNALDPDDCEIRLTSKRERSRSNERDENLRFFVITGVCSILVVTIGWIAFFYYLSCQEPDPGAVRQEFKIHGGLFPPPR